VIPLPFLLRRTEVDHRGSHHVLDGVSYPSPSLVEDDPPSSEVEGAASMRSSRFRDFSFFFIHHFLGVF